MIQFEGWFLPDGETHLQEWMTSQQQRRDGRIGYQLQKYEAALAYCPPDRRRVALDIGAHVGLWSYFMTADFSALHAFEPKREHVRCWNINMMGRRGAAQLHECALGDAEHYVQLETGPSSSGDTYVTERDVRATRPGAVRMRRLDGFKLTAVDFVKIDCEGFESHVLRGGHDTIRFYHPVIIVEQKPTHGAKFGVDDLAAVQYLTEEHGYVPRETINGDVILTWKPA